MLSTLISFLKDIDSNEEHKLIKFRRSRLSNPMLLYASYYLHAHGHLRKFISYGFRPWFLFLFSNSIRYDCFRSRIFDISQDKQLIIGQNR